MFIVWPLQTMFFGKILLQNQQKLLWILKKKVGKVRNQIELYDKIIFCFVIFHSQGMSN
jgi:hypothetical protein